MRLKNNLYTISSKAGLHMGNGTASGQNIVYCLHLNSQCPIYAAHFPGMPVTPGVCLLQMARELLEETMQVPDSKRQHLCLTEVKNAKFLSVVSPNQDEKLTCTLSHINRDEQAGDVTAQVAIETESETKAKLSIKCQFA